MENDDGNGENDMEYSFLLKICACFLFYVRKLMYFFVHVCVSKIFLVRANFTKPQLTGLGYSKTTT
jgi:hypothetical protein